jgi:hypothetical protein
MIHPVLLVSVGFEGRINITNVGYLSGLESKPESVTSQSTFVDLPIEVKHLAFI